MRRIKKARIKFISLVPKGANRLETIFKDDDSFEASFLVKGMDEEGELTAVVYAPELLDSQGEIASAAVIKDMLYTSAKEGVEIDLRHDNKALPRDKAYVAEQFIVQKGDPRFADMIDYQGNPVDVTGAWGVVIKIEDPELRKLYRDGSWRGVSMAGEAMFEEKKEDLADRIVKALEQRFNPNLEEDMKPEEIKALITKSVGEAVTASLAELKKTDATPEPEADATPKFSGDPTCKEDVEAHLEAVKKHDLQKRISEAKTAKQVEAILKEFHSEESPEDEAKKAKIAKLEKEIKKLQGASNQPEPAQKTVAKDDDAYSNVNKEDQDLASLGRKMASWANSQRGF